MSLLGWIRWAFRDGAPRTAASPRLVLLPCIFSPASLQFVPGMYGIILHPGHFAVNHHHRLTTSSNMRRRLHALVPRVELKRAAVSCTTPDRGLTPYSSTALYTALCIDGTRNYLFTNQQPNSGMPLKYKLVFLDVTLPLPGGRLGAWDRPHSASTSNPMAVSWPQACFRRLHPPFLPGPGVGGLPALGCGGQPETSTSTENCPETSRQSRALWER